MWATYIALFQLGFVDNSLSHARVFQNVLTEIGIHFEDGVGGLRLRRRIGIGTGLRSAIALLLFDLRHPDRLSREASK